jgi:hypothetical protein
MKATRRYEGYDDVACNKRTGFHDLSFPSSIIPVHNEKLGKTETLSISFPLLVNGVRNSNT